MKKTLLPLLFVVAVLGSRRAQAQLSSYLVRGAVNGAMLAGRGGAPQQKATLFVLPATYQAHTFPQKRTPAKKLPKAGQGGTEIAAIEQLLAGRFAALQADSTALLLTLDQDKEFSRLRTNLEAFNPFWNPDPYSQEMFFYRQHDDVRRRLARVPAGH